MSKPTFASVTDVPCACGHIERAANDPDHPVTFDNDLNEFNFEYSTPGSEHKSRWRIYHCPFCGGAAPKSSRGTLLAAVSDAEERRLRDLVKDIHTVEDAISALGEHQTSIRPKGGACGDPRGQTRHRPVSGSASSSTRDFQTRPTSG